MTPELIRDTSQQNFGVPFNETLYNSADPEQGTVGENVTEGQAGASVELPFADNTQMGLADASIAVFGQGNLIYTKSDFYRFNSKHWEKCDDKEVAQVVMKTATVINNSVPIKQQKEFTASRQSSVLSLIRTSIFRKDIQFDGITDAICCQNGELYLVDGQWQLRAHNRDNYRLTLLPHDYDPLAIAPRFDQFLDEIFLGDIDAADKKECLLQFLGYCLTTDNRYKKFLLLYGPGRGWNGKSKICTIAQLLVGDKNFAAMDPARIGERFQAASLFGKLVNVAPDLDQGMVIPDGIIKTITGDGDALHSEFKGRDGFDFVPYCKLLWGANHLPHCRDAGDAFFSRPLIIQLNRSFVPLNDHKRVDGDPVPDPELIEKLSAETQGIFNMALQALARLRHQKKFTEPASSVEQRKNWQFDVDQIAQFIDLNCSTGPHESCLSQELYKAYKEWTPKVGIEKPVGANKFGNKLEALGYKADRTTSARIRRGIALDPVKTKHF